MHFEFVHEFDAALDALELAVLAPTLLARIEPKLRHLEDVQQRNHDLVQGSLERVWSFRVKMPSLAERWVVKGGGVWEQRSVYLLSSHSARWTLAPVASADRKMRFSAVGSYRLVSNERGTNRLIEGDVRLDLPWPMGRWLERVVVSEIRKMFDAEAVTLRELVTLV